MRRASSESVPRTRALRKSHGKKDKKKPKSNAAKYRNPCFPPKCAKNKKPKTKGRYSNMGLTSPARPISMPMNAAKGTDGL